MLPPRCKTVSFTEQCVSVVCRLYGNQQCNITVENKRVTLLRQKLRQIGTHIAPSLVLTERYVVAGVVHAFLFVYLDSRYI